MSDQAKREFLLHAVTRLQTVIGVRDGAGATAIVEEIRARYPDEARRLTELLIDQALLRAWQQGDVEVVLRILAVG